MLKFRIF